MWKIIVHNMVVAAATLTTAKVGTYNASYGHLNYKKLLSQKGHGSKRGSMNSRVSETKLGSI